MSNNQVAHTNKKQSQLDKFSLGFEMNKTWAEARKEYVTTKK